MISLITTRIKLVSFSLTILCMVCSVSSACPTCKEGLGSSSNLINGYGWSIVFMMSMPFLIFAGISGYFYYEVFPFVAEGYWGSINWSKLSHRLLACRK
jgi:hypothetical protein